MRFSLNVFYILIFSWECYKEIFFNMELKYSKTVTDETFIKALTGNLQCY